MSPRLTKRFNVDGTTSLLCRGRVLIKHRDPDAIAAFVKGWFGDAKPRWGRAQFRKTRKETTT